MPVCPNCEYEYYEGIAMCPDCNKPLIDEEILNNYEELTNINKNTTREKQNA